MIVQRYRRISWMREVPREITEKSIKNIKFELTLALLVRTPKQTIRGGHMRAKLLSLKFEGRTMLENIRLK